MEKIEKRESSVSGKERIRGLLDDMWNEIQTMSLQKNTDEEYKLHEVLKRKIDEIQAILKEEI